MAFTGVTKAHGTLAPAKSMYVSNMQQEATRPKARFVYLGDDLQNDLAKGEKSKIRLRSSLR